MPLDAKDARTIDLDALRIASPCAARWDEMVGDERKRFCGACKLHVYDTSHLSDDEARTLVSAQGDGKLCLRLHRRADGTVLTRDCPVGRSRRRNRLLAVAAAVLGVVATGLPLSWGKKLAGLASADPSKVKLTPGDVARPVAMGKVACPEPGPRPEPTSTQANATDR